MNQLFYMMVAHSRQGGIGDGQSTNLHHSYAVMTKGLCTQKTVLRLHPTAKTRADP